MRTVAFLLLSLLLLGCQQEELPVEKPVSEDLEVSIIAGENYSSREPIAFQLKTTNYSIIYTNRTGGYSIGYYPSIWICRQTNETCENIEFRQMSDFSNCIGETVHIRVPSESIEKKDVFPAESYVLLFLWDQKDWKEVQTPCGSSFAKLRKPEQVPPGNYSITFVYWVSWSKKPRSVTADFRII